MTALRAIRPSRQILFSGVALSMAIVVIAALLALTHFRREAEARVATTAQNTAALVDRIIEGEIYAIDIALQASADEVARQLATGKVDAKAITDMLIRQQKRMPLVDNLRASNEHGESVYGPGTLSPPVNITDREYFFRLRDDPQVGLYASKPIIGRHKQKWIWLFARRINRPDGSFGGVVFASVFVERLEQLLAKLSMATGDVVTLRDAELTVVARHGFGSQNATPIGDKRIETPFAEALRANPRDGIFVSADSGLEGMPRTLSYRRNASYGFVSSVGIERRTALSEWRVQATIVTVLVVIIILVTTAFAWLADRAWQRQENDMVQHREAEARFRAIIEASPVPYALNNKQHAITYLNRAFVDTFGYSQDELPTLADWWSKAYPDPAYRQWVADTWLRSLEEAKRTGKAFVPMELSITCKDGSVRICLASAASLQDGLSGVHLVILYDITERKRAEETLKKQMEDLERFNRAMVGRELQMIELKQEINQLCLTAVLPVRYREHTAAPVLDDGMTMPGETHGDGGAK